MGTTGLSTRIEPGPDRRTASVRISALLSEDAVIPEIRSQERDSVLEEMVGHLKNSNRIRKDRDFYEKLIQREKLGSTAIGNGIAIPHCKLKEAERPLLAVGISQKGVRFEALDGKPTHLFFLIASSPDNPSQSLQILASIAHLVRKAGPLVKRIMAAKSPRRVIEIIREEEDKLEG
jgi:mannitol/fructose-specific phosphotransferase system IIA component (Ntr-type)